MARSWEGELQRRGTAEGPTLLAFRLPVARDDNFHWCVSWTFHYLQLKACASYRWLGVQTGNCAFWGQCSNRYDARCMVPETQGQRAAPDRWSAGEQHNRMFDFEKRSHSKCFAGHSGRYSTTHRGWQVTAPSLPCEGVPYNYQAVGPFVSRGDPPPVFTDAETGDDVRMALQQWRENALKHRGCGPTLAPEVEAGAPKRELSSFAGSSG